MIQTSFFGNHRNFPEGKKLVSISRFTPSGAKVDFNALELAPHPELLKEYKKGDMSQSEYTKRYIEETLNPLDPKGIATKYKDCIFLCYEKTGDFCHRHIVSDWLRSANIHVEEVVDHIKIAVVGSRGFSDYKYFKTVMDKLVSNYKSYSFVSGGAKNCADELAEIYAKEKGIEVIVHKPDWRPNGIYDNGAGFKRNVLIWDEIGENGIGIAFWDGVSEGTKHSFSISKQQNKTLYVVEYKSGKIYKANQREINEK